MVKNPTLLNMLTAKVASLEAQPIPKDDPVAAKAAYNARRQARLRLARALGSHTTAEWQALVAETGGVCVRCGHQHAIPAEQPCKAFIVPLFQGGSNAIENIMPLCRTCVSSRDPGEGDWLARWRKDRDTAKVVDGKAKAAGEKAPAEG